MRHFLRLGVLAAACFVLSPAAQAAPMMGAAALADAAAAAATPPTAVRWHYERERYSAPRRRGARSAYRASRAGVYWGGHFWSGPGYKCK